MWETAKILAKPKKKEIVLLSNCESEYKQSITYDTYSEKKNQHQDPFG